MKILEQYKGQIDEIIRGIKDNLKDDQYFANVFVHADDYGKKIEFCGTIKDAPRYTFTQISVYVRDINDTSEVIDRFVKNWFRRTESPKAIKLFKDFIAISTDIGWD